MPSEAPKPNARVHERDVALMGAIDALLPLRGPTAAIEDRARDLGFASFLGAVDIGFGGERVEYVRYGEASNGRLVLVSWEGEPVRATISCDGPPDHATHRASTLGSDFEATEYGHVARYEWPRHRAVMERRLAAALGTVDVAIAPELEASVDLVRAATAYGLSCGYGGTPPSGREALERLVDAGAEPELRLLLRGPDPVGRAYAAEGLRRLDAVSDADARAMEQLAEARITTCSGCTVWSRPFGLSVRAMVAMQRPPEPGSAEAVRWRSLVNAWDAAF